MKTFYQIIKRVNLKKITIIAMLFFAVQHVKATCNLQASFTYVDNGLHVVQFTNTTIGATSLHWNFDNGVELDSVPNPAIHFIQDGQYNVCLIAKDSNNCADTFCQTLVFGNICEYNRTLNYTLYPSDSSRYLCNQYSFHCFSPNSFTIIENLQHGIITNNNDGCLKYEIQSVGIDTFKMIACDITSKCDTTTYIINISDQSACNLLNEDTVYLTLDTIIDGRYVFPSFYDSATQSLNKFKLIKFGIDANTTLFSNRIFDSIIQLYRYVDSIDVGLFQFDGFNFNGASVIYSSSINSQRYSTGSGFEIFNLSTFNTSQIPFNYSTHTQGNYCLPLQFGSYTFSSPDPFLNIETSPCQSNYTNFRFYFNGIKSINIRDTLNNCRDKVVFVVGNETDICNEVTCLLPGDADHDLTVNNYDVLALGLSYNRVGVVRPNASTQYTLQASPDWNTTHYYGYNDKFADCNGDGIISATDATVINQNYIVQPQNIFNHRNSNTDTLPAITLVFDTLPTAIVNGNCVGAQLVADINVGDATQQIIDGYGVAFSVNYPFDNDSCFSVQVDLDTNSWFQTNNPVLLFYKNIPEYSRVDITVVRTDGTPRSGNGRIGNIKMITEGGIFGLYKNSSSINFDFSVTDAVMIDNFGNKIDINGSSTSVNFVVAGIKENKVDGLKIFPNPTKNKVFINAKETIQTVKVLDLSGRIIFENSFNKNNVELDFSSIENGMYIIEIKGKNSASYEKIFKQ